MSTTTVSKTVTRVNDPTLTSLSERIAATQTLLDLHEQIRANHKIAFNKQAKTINNGLDKGRSAIQNIMAQMDQSLEVQKLIVDETEQIAKYGRELVELLEERQELFRAMMGEDGEIAF
ncbi:unnamed protein product [Aureobasidium uvarum]|uniref:Uncharacterized protein n=1 Tax=Aureobasidium uvarum TaxID=2773716 RepID=A0A9N8PPQ6_9PEZI|nr:unnamed protein product [Aureobasidium uvarum]